MNNNIKTIREIKNFFKSIDFDDENIIGELEKIQTKEAVIERYSRFIDNDIEKERIEKERIRKEEIEKKRIEREKIEKENERFGIYCENEEALYELEEVFQDKGIYWNTSGHIVAFLFKSESKKLLDNFERFKHKLKWYSILSYYEKGFDWTMENIEKGISYGIWTWKAISGNTAINWDIATLERYKNLLDWKEISKNPSINWNFDLIDVFKNYLDWRAVKANKLLVWSDELVDKYATYIFSSGIMDPKEISFPYFESHKLFGKDKYDFYFQNNKNLHFSEYLIDKYADMWNFESLSYIGAMSYREQNRDERILFTDYLVDKYANRWNFKELSKSLNLRITTKIIEKYIDKWDWEYLVRNVAVKLEFSTIEKVKDIIDWGYVRIYPHLHWTEELIDKYAEYIFSNKFIRRRLDRDYCDRLDCKSYFESNENVEWTPMLIDKYKDKWAWIFLFRNNKIKFSREELNKYNDIFSSRQTIECFIEIPWEHFFEYGNTDWDEEIIDKYNKITYISPNGKIISKYSDKLTINPHVVWNEKLFDKYIKNLHPNDIAEFCEKAIFPNEIIINNQTLWDAEHVDTKYGEIFDIDIYKPLWRFLFLNKNIIWDEQLLESCIENMKDIQFFDFSGIDLSLQFIDKYWNILKKGNLKFNILNLTFEDFVKHEFKWLGYLINENDNIINESILCFLSKLKAEF